MNNETAEKVYCKDCNFFYHRIGDGTPACKKIYANYWKNTAVKKEHVILRIDFCDSEEGNKNNNCKYFEPRQSWLSKISQNIV